MDSTVSNSDNQKAPEKVDKCIKILQSSVLPPEFCDLQVEFHGCTYQMHRSLAVQQSEFFEEKILAAGPKSMLKLRLTELKAMKQWVFETIFKYIESNEIDLEICIIDDILAATVQLKMPGLMARCTAYLNEHFENGENNVGLTYEMALRTRKLNLATKALEYIAHNFNDISETENFLKYLPTTLETILPHPHLNVTCELRKVEAVVCWLNYEWPQRCSFACKLFQFLDFCLIPEKQLMEWCLQSDSQLVLSNDGCLRRVHRGLMYHMMESRSSTTK